MRYILTFLLCLSSVAFARQKVIFSGTLSVSGIGIDADSAKLYMYYNGVKADSINVSAQDLEGGDGQYIYIYDCHSDSSFGWSGQWRYWSDANNINIPDDAIVASYADSSADTTGLSASVYAEFIDGSNEDEFKAIITGLATTTGIDSLKDTIEDMSTRLLATGFSTHSAADVWAVGTRTLTTADWSTHSAADIWDLTTDGHTGAGTFGLMLEACSTDVANIGGWNPSSENLARDATKTDYMADVSALALEASLVDTTDIKAALIYWFDKLVSADNLGAVRYISPDGDNSNGLSLTTAWTDFDSIGNLSTPTKILVMPGTYTEVACTVRTSGLELIGVGGPGITALRGTADTTAYQDRIIVVNPRDSMLASLRISGFNFAHEVRDETHDPNFKCAIYIQDSVRYVEIDNNLFIADSNFKTITTASDDVKYLDIHHNMFAGNKVHAIDIAPEYSIIHNNWFMRMDSTMNDGVRSAIQLYTGARWNVINDNYFLVQKAAVSMVGADSNLVTGNSFGANVLTGSEMSADANSFGNIFTDNHGRPHIKLRESTGGDEIGTWEDRFYSMMKILMFQPPTLSVIPNGDLQLIANPPDSTIVEGWGGLGGTGYITGRRSFGALARSLYLESGGYLNTKFVYLHKGLHEVSVWAWLDNVADEARISCINDESVLQTWADGSNFVSGTGYTSWQRIGGMIYLPADDYYYFSLGTPDSTYLTGFTVHPDISGDSTNAAIADANKSNFHSDGDTNRVDNLATGSVCDSVNLAITDINKANFKADVSGLSTFDHSIDKVILVDSSAGAIHDVELKLEALGLYDSTLAAILAADLGLYDSAYAAILAADLGLYDSALAAVNAADLALYDSALAAINAVFTFTAGDVHATLDGENVGIDANDVTGDFAVADFEGAYFSEIGDTVRAAIHDSLYQVRVDSIISILGIITDDVLDIAYYWGACDGCYYRLFPEGGIPNKDSAIIIDPSLGVDSMVGKVIYLHGAEDDVVDTSYYYRDEPW